MIHDIVTNFSILLKKKVCTKLKKFDNMKKIFILFFLIVFCVSTEKPKKVLVTIPLKTQSMPRPENRVASASSPLANLGRRTKKSNTGSSCQDATFKRY